jgi:hypothetical protein
MLASFVRPALCRSSVGVCLIGSHPLCIRPLFGLFDPLFG